jgi:hypothetical protein
MAARRWWVAATLVLLAACGGTATSGLTPPRSAPAGSPQPSSRRWGPVGPPPSLGSAASAYYRGAGPAPEDEADGRPACDLLLPTTLGATPLAPVPSSQFNVFGEFVVRWTRTGSTGTGLTLTVYPAGDPADRFFYRPDAQLTVLDDGSQIRRTRSRPRAALLRIVSENCEYELAPSAELPPSGDDSILSSLRLMFAP